MTSRRRTSCRRSSSLSARRACLPSSTKSPRTSSSSGRSSKPNVQASNPHFSRNSRASVSGLTALGRRETCLQNLCPASPYRNLRSALKCSIKKLACLCRINPPLKRSLMIPVSPSSSILSSNRSPKNSINPHRVPFTASKPTNKILARPNRSHRSLHRDSIEMPPL